MRDHQSSAPTSSHWAEGWGSWKGVGEHSHSWSVHFILGHDRIRRNSVTAAGQGVFILTPSVRARLTSTGLNSPFLPKQGAQAVLLMGDSPAHTVLWRIPVSLGISTGWDREHGNYGLGLLKLGRKRPQQFICSDPASHGRCLFKLSKGTLCLEKCHSLVLYLMSKPAIRCKLSLGWCVFMPCEPNKYHGGSHVWIIPVSVWSVT